MHCCHRIQRQEPLDCFAQRLESAAQAIPVIGAVGGAAVNYAFTEYFQDMTRGHFIMRRLERAYGEEIIQAEYMRMAEYL